MFVRWKRNEQCIRGVPSASVSAAVVKSERVEFADGSIEPRTNYLFGLGSIRMWKRPRSESSLPSWGLEGGLWVEPDDAAYFWGTVEKQLKKQVKVYLITRAERKRIEAAIGEKVPRPHE